MWCFLGWGQRTGCRSWCGLDRGAPSDTLTVTLGASPRPPEQKGLQPLREGKRGRGMREQEDELVPSSHLVGPKQANRKKKPMGNRNFQFSVTVISVRFKAVKEALMNRFKELKETILEELKEGTKAVFHQIEYQ